jgi:hypothetical protein
MNDAHEFVSNRTFRLRRWREVLDRVAAEVSENCQAICPFGFEVLGDPKFLRGDLTRFYVLLKIAPGDAGISDALGLEFATSLYSELAEWAPDFARSVQLVRCNRSTCMTGQGDPAVPVRMINVLCRVTRDPPLTDYGKYVVAAIDGILTGELGEAHWFERSTRARRRLFQLFQMIDFVFHAVHSTELAGGKLPGSLVYREELKDFMVGRENQPVRPEERMALEEIVRPKLRELSIRLRAPVNDADRIVRETVGDCYADRVLTINASTGMMTPMIDFIARTYTQFEA